VNCAAQRHLYSDEVVGNAIGGKNELKPTHDDDRESNPGGPCSKESYGYSTCQESWSLGVAVSQQPSLDGTMERLIRKRSTSIFIIF
jgi:hypothetical protein